MKTIIAKGPSAAKVAAPQNGVRPMVKVKAIAQAVAETDALKIFSKYFYLKLDRFNRIVFMSHLTSNEMEGLE